MLRLTVITLCIFVLCGCRSNDNIKNSVWSRYNPSFEIDDPKDGLFPNKSPRVGEKAYAARIMGGMKHKTQDGLTVKWGAGMRNQHVGEVLLEVEKDI